jgi:hypothetical protein
MTQKTHIPENSFTFQWGVNLSYSPSCNPISFKGRQKARNGGEEGRPVRSRPNEVFINRAFFIALGVQGYIQPCSIIPACNKGTLAFRSCEQRPKAKDLNNFEGTISFSDHICEYSGHSCSLLSLLKMWTGGISCVNFITLV